MTRLLFAPVLFAALLVGRDGLDAIPAAVLAAVAAWLIVTAVERHTEAGTEESVAPAPASGS